MTPEEEAKVLKQPWARGHRKLSILRDLASQTMTQSVIAEKYGITQGAVSLFSRAPANAAAIAEMRKDLEDKFAGMWIAQKDARIAAYQQMAEDVQEALASGGMDSALAKVHLTAIKSVAEEMGQLPNRVTVEQNVKSTIEVVGVNPEDVK